MSNHLKIQFKLAYPNGCGYETPALGEHPDPLADVYQSVDAQLARWKCPGKSPALLGLLGPVPEIAGPLVTSGLARNPVGLVVVGGLVLAGVAAATINPVMPKDNWTRSLDKASGPLDPKIIPGGSGVLAELTSEIVGSSLQQRRKNELRDLLLTAGVSQEDADDIIGSLTDEEIDQLSGVKDLGDLFRFLSLNISAAGRDSFVEQISGAVLPPLLKKLFTDALDNAKGVTILTEMVGAQDEQSSEALKELIDFADAGSPHAKKALQTTDIADIARLAALAKSDAPFVFILAGLQRQGNKAASVAMRKLDVTQLAKAAQRDIDAIDALALLAANGNKDASVAMRKLN